MRTLQSSISNQWAAAILFIAASSPSMAWAQSAATANTPSTDPVLTVYNEMQDAVHFWIKSETKSSKNWTHLLIGQGETHRVTLKSPDRFELMSCDGQGGEFYLGLRPLRKMLEKDPGMVLTLGGIMKTQSYNERYWSANQRQWLWRKRFGYARAAVLYEFQMSDGSVIVDTANRR